MKLGSNLKGCFRCPGVQMDRVQKSVQHGRSKLLYLEPRSVLHAKTQAFAEMCLKRTDTVL